MDHADHATAILERAAEHYRRQAKAAPARRIGVCTTCGEKIEPERMQAMPYAVRCIECQGEAERYG